MGRTGGSDGPRMKVAIHQPQYLPWLGHFAKLAASDCWIVLDTVQYEKHGWQNRNRIKTPRGAQWLTVPVHARLGTSILDVAIDAAQPWARKHCQALRANYGRAPYFLRYFPDLQEVLLRPWRSFTELGIEVTRLLASALGVSRPTLRASELAGTRTDPTARLVDLCGSVGAGTYLAGGDSVAYLDLAQFERGGVAVWRQQYTHPGYTQQHGPFVPFLSVVDLLFNHGDASLNVLQGGDQWVPVASAGARTGAERDGS